MSYIANSPGGNGLHFRSAAASDIPGMRMETKYCELCSRMYVRPVNPEARVGRDCDRCQERRRQRQAKEAREHLAARQPLVRPAEGWSPQTKMMPQ
jgi:hypothetical protein